MDDGPDQHRRGAPFRRARRRVGEAGWSVVLTPVAAGLAWYVAHNLLGHRQPFFAPVAAAVALSKTTVLRGQRALQMIAGVALGIGIGTAVKAVAGPGSGAVAVGVAVLIALVAALVLGGGFLEQGVLFVNQSVSSAILMITVAGAATGSERLLDALVGGGVALLLTVILFPVAPLPLIQDAAQRVFATLHDTLARLEELAGTADTADLEWMLATGQRIHHELAGLQQAESAARQVASLSPRRWPERSRVRQASEQVAPLPLLAATVLTLVHADAAAPRTEEPLPPALCEALHELTSAFAALAEADDTGAAQAAAAHATRARGLAAGAAKAGGLPAQLAGRLIEGCADDTLRLTGRACRDAAEPPVRS